MKRFDQLTELGKKRRLYKVVQLALQQYDLTIISIRYYTEATNILYLLKDNNGFLYACKIFEESSSKIEDNKAEAYFINQVDKLTSLNIPSIIPNNDGSDISIVNSDLFKQPIRIAIYKWLRGIDFDGHETPKRFFQLGQIMATMHEVTKKLKLPLGISPKKWDSIFYFRNEKPIFHTEQYKKYYKDEISFLQKTITYSDEKLLEFYKNTPPQLVHGDMNPWNIMLYKNQLRIVDFEDVILAYPVHDVAIFLYYYKYDQKFDYIKVKEQFFSGYKSITRTADFSQFDIDFLINARQLNFLNYILEVSDKPTEYINNNIPRVKEFIKQYNINI